LKEANLYDYRNRVYSAELGRFLQTDPIRFNAGDYNLYRYVGNRVSLLFDPTGLAGWSEKADSISLTGIWRSSGVEYSWGDTANGFAIANAIYGLYEVAATVTCVCGDKEKKARGTRTKKVDLVLGPYGPIQISLDTSPIGKPTFRNIIEGIGKIIGEGAKKIIPPTPLPNPEQKADIENSVRQHVPDDSDLGDGWKNGSPCDAL
jgi:hypothetical protein